MRAVIAASPDGQYSFIDWVDDDGIDRDTQLKIQVQVTIAGDQVSIDLDGSSPQATGPINCTLNMTRSAVICGVLMSIGRDVPANAGCYRPITIHAPAGSVVHAQYPAPVANVRRPATGSSMR